MIRINLAPSKKRKGPKVRTAAPASEGGAVTLALWLLGWGALGAAGTWLVFTEGDATGEVRKEGAAINKKADDISKEIDEEGLQALEDKNAQLRAAIKKLDRIRRTPVYVMYELGTILTQHQMPDVDHEKQRQAVAADPSSRLTPGWDSTSVWIYSVKEEGGSLAIEGAARDATDLAEFTRRLRASSRFGNVSHPDYQRVTASDDTATRHLEWKLNVSVKRWD